MTSPTATFSTGEPNLCVCLSVCPSVRLSGSVVKKNREENSEKNCDSQFVYYSKSILTEMFFKINALTLEVFFNGKYKPFYLTSLQNRM